MTFTGNIHSMLKLPPSMGRLPTPMGMLLADLHPASIDLRGSGGTMWNCSPDCGVHDQGKNQAAPMQPLTYIADGDDGIYSGAILVGATTASLPATGAALP